jgi:O-antigen/teichoic acid export membrane protein
MRSRQALIASESVGAVKNSYLGTLLRVCTQFGAQILIMRALGPELMGAFVYVLLAHTLLTLVIDQGLGWSLIQGDFGDDSEIAILFSRTLLTALACMLCVLAVSYPVERMVNNALVGSALRLSAPACLVNGLYILSNAKLRADMRYREIQTALTVSYLFAYPIVGLAMALHGFGMWALLSALYVQAILQVGIMYFYSRHSLKLKHPFLTAKSGPLGLHVTGINVINWAVDNCGGLFVSSSGAFTLGNFNAALVVARTPVVYFVVTLQTIVFSAASAVGHDLRLIRRLYLGTLGLVGFMVFPAYGYVCTHADFIVWLLFGKRWIGAAETLPGLAVGMMALALSTLSGAILTAIGAQRKVVFTQATCLLLMCIGLYASKPYSLFYAGFAISFAYFVSCAMQMRAMAQKAEICAFDVFASLRGPALIAVIMAFPISMPIEGRSAVIVTELIVHIAKCAAIAQLVRVFPQFFVCKDLSDLLKRFTNGRRLVAALGLH